MFVYAKRISKL